MARPVVGNPFDGQIGTVAPTARPVDTYVRAVVKSSPFEALSSTLSNLEKKAIPALQREQQRRAEKEFKEGQALYNTNRIAIGEAVKKGLIDEGESPYLRKGYRIAQMNTLGMRYTSELESALERQKLYTSGDPERIEKFVTQFQEKFISNNGMSGFAASELSEHFGVSAAKSNEVFRRAWGEKHVSWQRAQNYAAFEREVAEATISLFKPEMSDDERKAAMGSFSTWLEAKGAAASTDGMDNGRVLDTILQGVGIAVQQTGQTDILEVFKSTKFGTGAASTSLKVQAKLLAIEAKAIQIENANAVAADIELNTAYETARATTRSISDDFTTDPSLENRKRLNDAIDTLMQTPDDDNTRLAAALRTQLRTADVASLNGGLNKTADTEIRTETALMGAQTFGEATRILEIAADNGELTPADVTTKMNKWRTQFDPALDAAVGLNFNTTTSVEGAAVRELSKIIRGNEFDYNEQSSQRARTEAHKLKQQIRLGVQLFQEKNQRYPTEYELEEMTYNAQQLILDRLLNRGVLERPEENG
jgi:hypothetical protein